MKLVIGGKTYELEFTFEAAQYDDCVNGMFEYVGATAEGAMKQSVGSVLKTMAGSPNLVITLFYAGLMEHNPVENRDAAKALLKQYFYENKGKKNANFGGMFEEITKQMEKDGFLDLIGLNGAANAMEEAMKQQTTAMKQVKMPMDHQKSKTSQN